MVKMIMHGCNGAMGQVITKLASEDNDAEIVAGIDCADNRENPYPVFTSCDACDVDADVIVDFSVAQAVDGVLAYALKRKMPLVLCTTGLSDKQLEDVKAASSQIPVLRSANMSLGVNTVFKLAAAAAKILGEAGYDIEIVEKHHNKKMDAPSGTALAIAMPSMKRWITGIHINWIVRQNVPRERPMRSVFRLSEAVLSSVSMRFSIAVRMKLSRLSIRLIPKLFLEKVPFRQHGF